MCKNLRYSVPLHTGTTAVTIKQPKCKSLDTEEKAIVSIDVNDSKYNINGCYFNSFQNTLFILFIYFILKFFTQGYNSVGRTILQCALQYNNNCCYFNSFQVLFRNAKCSNFSFFVLDLPHPSSQSEIKHSKLCAWLSKVHDLLPATKMTRTVDNICTIEDPSCTHPKSW